MRLLFRIFALLDALSLVFLSMQLWEILKHFSEFTLLAEKVSGVLMFVMFFLILGGVWFAVLVKKTACILYYIQFPFRLYLWIFTFGFITLLPEAFGRFEDWWLPALLKVCFAGEVVRLFLTIKAHRFYFGRANQG